MADIDRIALDRVLGHPIDDCHGSPSDILQARSELTALCRAVIERGEEVERLRAVLDAVHSAWNGKTTHESALDAIARVRVALRGKEIT